MWNRFSKDRANKSNSEWNCHSIQYRHKSFITGATVFPRQLARLVSVYPVHHPFIPRSLAAGRPSPDSFICLFRGSCSSASSWY